MTQVLDQFTTGLDIFKSMLNIDITLSINIILLTTLVFLILFILQRYPVFQTLNTLSGFIPVLIHELGHAVICSITLGKVTDIRVVLTKWGQNRSGAQGYATLSNQLWLSKVLSTLAGYLACPAMFLLGIYLITTNYAMLFILLFFILFLYYFMKTKQKIIALIFISLIILGLVNLNFAHVEFITTLFTILVNVTLGLLLGEMLQSAYITFKSTFTDQSNEWDGSQLKELTMLPTIIWFAVWIAFDIFVIYQSIILLVKNGLI